MIEFLQDLPLQKLPDLCSLTIPSNETDMFFNSGSYTFDQQKKEIVRNNVNCIKVFYVNHSDSYNPISLLDSGHHPSSYFLRIAYWYQAIKLLDKENIEKLMSTYRIIRDDAKRIINKQESCTMAVFQQGSDVFDHVHPPVTSGHKAYTLSYVIKIGNNADSKIALRVADDEFKIFIDNNITRISFDTQTNLHGSRYADKDKNMYLWIVFEGITEFADEYYRPSAEKSKVWRLYDNKE